MLFSDIFSITLFKFSLRNPYKLENFSCFTKYQKNNPNFGASYPFRLVQWATLCIISGIGFLFGYYTMYLS